GAEVEWDDALRCRDAVDLRPVGDGGPEDVDCSCLGRVNHSSIRWRTTSVTSSMLMGFLRSRSDCSSHLRSMSSLMRPRMRSMLLATAFKMLVEPLTFIIRKVDSVAFGPMKVISRPSIFTVTSGAVSSDSFDSSWEDWKDLISVWLMAWFSPLVGQVEPEYRAGHPSYVKSRIVRNMARSRNGLPSCPMTPRLVYFGHGFFIPGRQKPADFRPGSPRRYLPPKFASVPS